MPIKRAIAPVLLVLVLSAVVLAKGDTPPRHDVACQKTSDCGFTHMDERCCWECGVRVGSAAWVGAHESVLQGAPGQGLPRPRVRPGQRPARVRARALHAMSRHSKPHLRCRECRMHLSLCICALLPRIETRTRVVLIIHQLESLKPTNTGAVAARCLPNSAVVYRGRPPEAGGA